MEERIHDPAQEIASIELCVRIRPLDSRDRKDPKAKDTLLVSRNHREVYVQVADKVYRKFGFDLVFGETERNPYVFYKSCKPQVERFLSGANSSIMAYGQSGTGKTFTMGLLDKIDSNSDGLVPLSLRYIFENLPKLRSASVSLSMVQVYKDDVYDLLDSKRSPCQLREDPNSKVFFIPGLYIVPLEDEEQAIELINAGLQLRTMAAQSLNATSSRSHLIITIYLKQKTVSSESMVSMLTFADLAGSERVGKSESKGIRLEEAKSINSSLSSLAEAICHLRHSNDTMLFRQNKLTKLLQSSLMGHSHILMLGMIRKSNIFISETISTLQFVLRCRQIRVMEAQCMYNDIQPGLEQIDADAPTTGQQTNHPVHSQKDFSEFSIFLGKCLLSISRMLKKLGETYETKEEDSFCGESTQRAINSARLECRIKAHLDQSMGAIPEELIEDMAEATSIHEVVVIVQGALKVVVSQVQTAIEQQNEVEKSQEEHDENLRTKLIEFVKEISPTIQTFIQMWVETKAESLDKETSLEHRNANIKVFTESKIAWALSSIQKSLQIVIGENTARQICVSCAEMAQNMMTEISGRSLAPLPSPQVIIKPAEKPAQTEQGSQTQTSFGCRSTGCQVEDSVTKTKLSMLMEANKKMKKENDRLKSEVQVQDSQMEEEVALIKEKYQELQKKLKITISETGKDTSNLRRQLEDSELSLREEKQKRELLEESLKRADQEREERLDYLKKEMDEKTLMESRWKEIEREYVSLQQKHQTTCSQLQNALSQVEAFSQELLQKNSELSAKRKEEVQPPAEFLQELSALKSKLSEAAYRVRDLETEGNSKSEELKEIKNQKNALVNRAEEAIKEKESLEAKMTKMKEIIENMGAGNGEKDEELALKTLEVESLRTEVQELENKVQEIEAGWQETQEELARTKEIYDQSNQEKENENQEQLSIALNTIKELQQTLDTKSHQLESLSEQYEALQNQNTNLESQNNDVAASEKMIEELQGQISQLQTFREEQNQAIEQFNKENTELKNSIDDLKAEILEKNSQISQLSEQCELSQQELTTSREEMEIIKTKNQDFESRVRELESELQVSEARQANSESEQVQKLVSQLQETHSFLQMAKQEEEKMAGQITHLEDKFEQECKEKENLESRCNILSAEQDNLASELSNLTEKEQTLSQTIQQMELKLEESVREAKIAQEELQNHKETSNKEIEDHQRAHKEALLELEQTNNQLKELGNLKESTKIELEQEILSLKETQENTLKELDEFKQKLSAAELDNQALLSSQEENSEDKKAQSSQIANLEEQLSKLKTQLADSEEQSLRYKEQASESSSHSAENNRLLEEKAREIKILREAIESLKEENSKIVQMVKEKHEKSNSYEDKFMKAQGELEEAKLELIEVKEKLQRGEAEAGRAKEETLKLKEEVLEMKQAKKELNAAATRLSNKKDEVLHKEKQINKLEKEKDELMIKVEKLEVSLEESRQQLVHSREKSLEELRAQHQSVISMLKESHSKQVQRMEERITQLVKDQDSKEADIVAEKNNLISRLEEALKLKEQESMTLAATNQEALTKAQEKLEDTVEDMKHNFERENKSQIEDKNKLQKMIEGLQKEVNHKNDNLKELNSSVSVLLKTNQDLESQLNEAQEKNTRLEANTMSLINWNSQLTAKLNEQNSFVKQIQSHQNSHHRGGSSSKKHDGLPINPASRSNSSQGPSKNLISNFDRHLSSSAQGVPNKPLKQSIQTVQTRGSSNENNKENMDTNLVKPVSLSLAPQTHLSAGRIPAKEAPSMKNSLSTLSVVGPEPVSHTSQGSGLPLQSLQEPPTKRELFRDITPGEGLPQQQRMREETGQGQIKDDPSKYASSRYSRQSRKSRGSRRSSFKDNEGQGYTSGQRM